MASPEVVVLDIEGTITTLDYVRVELMGWIRARLPRWVAAHGNSPQVASCRAAWGTQRREGEEEEGADVAREALRLMDEDSKTGPLK